MKVGKKKKYVQPKVKTEMLATRLFNFRALRDEIGEFNLLAATEADSDCGVCGGSSCSCGSCSCTSQ